MKITFKELMSKKEWLHKELLSSLTPEVLETVKEDLFYDVKLLVNGIEIEPTFYNDLVNRIEVYVDAQAQTLVKEKLEETENKAKKLDNLIKDAIDKIKIEFDIEE